ncbi:MAG TPA: hypothetical protein VJL83_05090 [Patescibacteria group bacterium]|nr:hypothetical protein [Patescibacteria group bacterium]
MKNYKAIAGALMALLFFIAGVLTLSHYRINIDEPVHFLRGQGYFRLLTTGKKTYYILYQKAGIVSDLESYHLFEVFISSLLVFLVFYITAERYGMFAGFVAALSLSLYPLFLGESRFNIKDPAVLRFIRHSIRINRKTNDHE